jgi:hypothetical protein
MFPPVPGLADSTDSPALEYGIPAAKRAKISFVENVSFKLI